ncbi:hypothetical protein FXF51_41825 [Nonomuraea sp. PA05]|uniref:hypothetical protein n=1 Tax=Nonomuraea sp. PA05 TaxID=2604466 RepID=UPI0011D8E20E|nr:hypothetical protein [Nonomuraea sp. PA05]TYB57019.1 hypothetical protein FXF51_41825 [Nonomuraea sp. PA05]
MTASDLDVADMWQGHCDRWFPLPLHGAGVGDIDTRRRVVAGQRGRAHLPPAPVGHCHRLGA